MLDPRVQAMFEAAAGKWPAARSVPPQQLRALAALAAKGMPTRDLPLASVRDDVIPGPGGDLPVRIYTPERRAASWPLIVFFHGGGWILGDLDSQDMIARGLAVSAKAMVMSVDYRLAPEHRFPAAAEDSLAAVRWAARHAAELGADARRLAVAGDSAGAVLSAGVAIQLRDAGEQLLSAQVLFYGGGFAFEETPSLAQFGDGPLLSRDDIVYYWSQYLNDPECEKHDPRVAPGRASSHTGLPPAFVASAECDPVRDECERYAQVLGQAGVAVQMKRYDGMPHGFVSWAALVPAAQQAIDDAAAFLTRCWCAA
jgi:acetyl esterase